MRVWLGERGGCDDSPKGMWGVCDGSAVGDAMTSYCVDAMVRQGLVTGVCVMGSLNAFKYNKLIVKTQHDCVRRSGTKTKYRNMYTSEHSSPITMF